MVRFDSRWTVRKGLAVAIAAVATRAWAAEILKTDGFSDCGTDASIKVDKIDISYNNQDKTVTFDVSGSSLNQQTVMALLNVTAYGNSVYTKSFNPCDKDTFVESLCPVPAGSFAARGTQTIPTQFADMVPAIAFQVPDIEAEATLQLKSLDGGKKVACFQSKVSNGKTANVPAVQYIVVGIATAAWVVTGLSTAGVLLSGGGASVGGLGTLSPSFGEVFGLFHGIATTGMLSVRHPPIYLAFSKNFGFSVLLVGLKSVQSRIDSFRAKTGGNLTQDSVEYLEKATLIFPDGSTKAPNQGLPGFKRGVIHVSPTLSARDNSGQANSSFQHTVKGIQAYVEQLTVPKSDVFMTALLIVAIGIAAIVVGILLVKVILELWALNGRFPKSLAGFRKHYWGSIARTITSLILILYGIWVLYCIFQFTNGDSWVAKTLAGVTLAIFTGILTFFSWKIWSTAKELKNKGGDSSGLYYDKKVWIKYSLFYESYKMDYWWLFIPAIAYMFVKGSVIAATDGRGMIQTISLLVVEAVMLILLLWSRPYERKSGNVINIAIAVVRVLSVVCVLLFVEEFGIKQTTQTVAGVVLIAVQSALTGILAILIAWNALNACCQANPHRKRRKEIEQDQRDMDNLTPLDARNSLLLHRARTGTEPSMFSFQSDSKERRMTRSNSHEQYYPNGATLKPHMSPSAGSFYQTRTPTTPNDATRSLVGSAAPMGMGGYYPTAPTVERDYQAPVTPPGHEDRSEGWWYQGRKEYLS